MGRYILFEFDDNGSAVKVLNLFKDLLNSENAVDEDITRLGLIIAAQADLVGVFSKPSKLCDCVRPSERSLHGSTYGWWVCTTCKRPKHGSGHNLWNMLDPKGIGTKHKELMLHVKWIKGKDGKVVTARTGWQLKREISTVPTKGVL
jgi:hypothetical protein